jgi:hypothetical protein
MIGLHKKEAATCSLDGAVAASIKLVQNLMAKLSKKAGIILFILVNIAGCFFLYCLQCLRYAFIGKVNPSLSFKAQHSEAIRFATMAAKGILLETLIGVLILYIINRTLTKHKITIYVALAELAGLVLLMLSFSSEYVAKFYH